MQDHKDKCHGKTQRPLICAENRTKGKPELANTNLSATIQESRNHALIPQGKILSRLSMRPGNPKPEAVELPG